MNNPFAALSAVIVHYIGEKSKLVKTAIFSQMRAEQRGSRKSLIAQYLFL